MFTVDEYSFSLAQKLLNGNKQARPMEVVLYYIYCCLTFAAAKKCFREFCNEYFFWGISRLNLTWAIEHWFRHNKFDGNFRNMFTVWEIFTRFYNYIAFPHKILITVQMLNQNVEVINGGIQNGKCIMQIKNFEGWKNVLKLSSESSSAHAVQLKCMYFFQSIQ